MKLVQANLFTEQNQTQSNGFSLIVFDRVQLEQYGNQSLTKFGVWFRSTAVLNPRTGFDLVRFDYTGLT